MAQRNSRLAIVAALEGRLGRMPLDAVRVTDLCADAGVSRTAFYHHFGSVYDVPVWLWDSLVEQSLGRIGPGLTFREAHRQCFELALGHRELFERSFSVSGLDGPFHNSERGVLGLYERMAGERGVSFEPAELLRVRFYNAGASAMTREWAVGGMVETPDAMADCYASMAPACLVRVLEG